LDHGHGGDGWIQLDHGHGGDGLRKKKTCPVLFISKGSYFYDQPDSLLLVIEPVLFINLNVCGPFWDKNLIWPLRSIGLQGIGQVELNHFNSIRRP
jgi:hypothetical protein